MSQDLIFIPISFFLLFVSDVGSWTIDIMHVKDGVPVESKCETFTESMVSYMTGVRANAKGYEYLARQIA